MVTNKALDGKNTAFGRLIGDKALSLLNELTTADKILSITIVDTGTAATATQTRTPGPTRTATATRTETPTPTPSPTK